MFPSTHHPGLSGPAVLGCMAGLGGEGSESLAEGPWETSGALPSVDPFVLRETPAVPVGLLYLRALEPGPAKVFIIESTYWFSGHTSYHLVKFVTKDDKSNCLFWMFVQILFSCFLDLLK